MITAGQRVNKSSSAHNADGSSTNTTRAAARERREEKKDGPADKTAPLLIGGSFCVGNIGCCAALSQPQKRRE